MRSRRPRATSCRTAGGRARAARGAPALRAGGRAARRSSSVLSPRAAGGRPRRRVGGARTRQEGAGGTTTARPAGRARHAPLGGASVPGADIRRRARRADRRMTAATGRPAAVSAARALRGRRTAARRHRLPLLAVPPRGHERRPRTRRPRNARFASSAPPSTACVRRRQRRERGFCRDCGSSLFWRSEGDGRSRSPRARSTTDAGLRVATHIYVDSAAGWEPLPDGRPGASRGLGVAARHRSRRVESRSCGSTCSTASTSTCSAGATPASTARTRSRISRRDLRLGARARPPGACRQTNHEGEYVEWLHAALDVADGLVLNPAAWTHYSWAIHDAVEPFTGPVVEVHISNVDEREEWRRHSVLEGLATARVIGKGIDGYREALALLAGGATHEQARAACGAARAAAARHQAASTSAT